MFSNCVPRSYSDPDFKSISRGSVIGSSVALLVGSLWLVLKFRLLNSFPCESNHSVIHYSTNLVSYTGMTACQLAAGFSSSHSKTAFRLFCYFGTSLLLLDLIFLIFRGTFWSFRMHKTYLVWHSKVFCIAVVNLMYPAGIDHTAFIIFLIIQLLVSKLMQNAGLQLLKIDVFKPVIQKHRLYIGVVLMEKYIKQSMARHFELTSEEQHLHLYYIRLWAHHKSAVYSLVDADDDEAETNREKQIGLINFLISLDSKEQSIDVIRLMLFLQTVSIVSSLGNLRVMFRRFKHLNGDSIFAEFETYAFNRLIESKLDALYKGKIKDDDSFSQSIFDNFECLEFSLDQISEIKGQSFIDLKRVFYSHINYTGFVGLIEVLVAQQKRTFEHLTEKLIINGQLYKSINEHSMRTRQLVDKLIKFMFKYSPKDNLYSYFYPMLIFYYSLIKYDIKTSDQFMKTYKKKLQSLMSVRNQDKGFSNLSIEIDTVTLKVDMDRNQTGIILDTSLNYFEHIGLPKDGKTISGVHINSLMLPIFVEKHSEAIQNLESYSQLEKHSLVMLKDFSGSTRKLTACIRVNPSIKGSASALCLLDFKRYSQDHFIILDQHLNVVGLSEYPRRLFEHAGVSFEGKQFNIRKISRSLASCLHLFQLLRKEVSEESNKLKVMAFKSYLFEALTQLDHENNTRGIRYSIDHDSPLFGSLPKKSWTVLFEINSTLGISTSLVYIKPEDLNAENFLDKKQNRSKLMREVSKSSEEVVSSDANVEKSGKIVQDKPSAAQRGESLFNKASSIPFSEALLIDDLIAPVADLIDGFISSQLRDKTKGMSELHIEQNLKSPTHLVQEPAIFNDLWEMREIAQVVKQFAQDEVPEAPLPMPSIDSSKRFVSKNFTRNATTMKNSSVGFSEHEIKVKLTADPESLPLYRFQRKATEASTLHSKSKSLRLLAKKKVDTNKIDKLIREDEERTHENEITLEKTKLINIASSKNIGELFKLLSVAAA